MSTNHKWSRWALFVSVFVGAGSPSCASSGDRGDETHFQTCATDHDCENLGADYRCESRICRHSNGDSGLPDGSGALNDSAPALSEGRLSGIAATDSGWVAVGGVPSQTGPSRPLVITSTDARHWERVDVPSQGGSLFDVAFANGTVVAVGPGGNANSQVLVKPPSGPWQVQLLGTNDDQVLAGNGVFLMTAGVEPGARVSSDGLTWTSAPISGSSFAFDGERFAAFGSHFIAGDGGSFLTGFRSSTVGVSWTDPVPTTSPLNWLGSLARVGDEILGFGSLSCSPGLCLDVVQLRGPRGTAPSDLEITKVPWSDVPTTIVASDVRAVMVTSQESPTARYVIRTTPLPLGSAAWSEFDTTTRGWTIRDVAYASGTFTAVGYDGSRALVVTSTDGTNWEEAAIGP